MAITLHLSPAEFRGEPMSAVAKQIDSGVLPSSSRYQVTRCIAKGGMGSVYVGVQRGAGGFARPVAIKRMHPHLLEDAEARNLILEEARLASAVRHPNVVSINDVEEVSGELLLVMDYIEGGSLSQLLARGGQVPMEVALRIVVDACAGIDAIHTAKDAQGIPLGLVHRDVSPQNILVGFDGVARVTDFGIAKSAASPKRTAKNVRRGKYGYMAPEYLKTGTITSHADLFAIGVLLWECLAGRRLFKGEDNAATIKLGMKAEVPSLVDEVGISEELDAVIKRTLARSPEDRYRSVAELGAAIEHSARELIASRLEVTEYVRDVLRPKSVPPAPVPELPSASMPSATEESSGVVASLPPRNDAPSEIKSLAPLLEPSVDVEMRPAESPRWENLKTPPAKHAHKVFKLEERLQTLPSGERHEPTKKAVVGPTQKSPRRKWLWGILGVVIALGAATTTTAIAAAQHDHHHTAR